MVAALELEGIDGRAPVEVDAKGAPLSFVALARPSTSHPRLDTMPMISKVLTQCCVSRSFCRMEAIFGSGSSSGSTKRVCERTIEQATR